MRRVIMLDEEALCLFHGSGVLPRYTEGRTHLGPPYVARCSRKYSLRLSTFFFDIACDASLLELQGAFLHWTIP
jgi:hypothetical protein